MIYALLLCFYLPVSHGFTTIQPDLSLGRQQSTSCTWLTARPRRRRYDDDDDEEEDYYYHEDNRDSPREASVPRTVMIPRRRPPMTDDDTSPVSPLTTPPTSAVGESATEGQPRRDMRSREAYSERKDFYYEEDEDSGFFDDTQFEPGPDNYWSNPVGRVDEPPARRRRRSSSSRRSRLPQRQTFVPPAVREFYDKLFWFGFGEGEDDNDEYVAQDKGRDYFGGTKGKFNGLSYYDDPEQRRPRNDEPYYDDQDREYGRSDPVEHGRRRQSRVLDPTPSSPPNEFRKHKVYEKEGEEGYVSRYADEEEEEQDDDEWIDRRRAPPHRRRRRGYYIDDSDRSQTSWNLWDAFLGRSDSESRRRREERAAEYDRAMGLTNNAPTPASRRRPGFTYRYEDEDDYGYEDDRFRKVDAEPIESPAVEVIDAEPVVANTSTSSTVDAPLSWEDRVLAVEQVPPMDIPAWGPTGDLGVDARTQAVSDALEDVGDAQARVRNLERTLQQAREDVSILRVDAQLQRKRLQQQRGLYPDEFNEACRRMDDKVDDAARKARFQQGRLESAQNALKDIETRHWALLQHFDPELASKVVDEAKNSTRFADIGTGGNPGRDNTSSK